jgi:uncharacterized phage-associated protein
MANVHDVAAYILEKRGGMTAMKLQKLAYYSQAWHLVWEERPLFDSTIEAWANGPVVYDLYTRHRGQFSVQQWTGSSAALSADEKSTIDAVLGYYGNKTAHELSELTHRESPWRDARAGLPDGARSSAVITDAALHEYYDGLTSSTP